MEILGIGPLELFAILVIAFLVLGPKGMVTAGRTLGRLMRKVITSSEWRTVQKASREIKYLPNRLMREAALEDLNKDFTDINKIGSQLTKDIKQAESDFSSWTTPPSLTGTEPVAQEQILPTGIDSPASSQGPSASPNNPVLEEPPQDGTGEPAPIDNTTHAGATPAPEPTPPAETETENKPQTAASE